MRDALAGLRLALGLLTVYPVRSTAEVTPRVGRWTVLAAPLVGLSLWVPAAVLVYAVRAWLTDYQGRLLPATVGIAVLALLTRALHLDGLADTADALGSYRDPATAREVMRRGDVGPTGVVAVVLVLALQAMCLNAAIDQHHGSASLLVGVLSGRLAVVLSCVRGTPVAEGSRLGALVVGTVPRAAAAVVAVAGCALGALAALLDVDTYDRHAEVAQAVAAPLAALLVTWVLRRHVIRRLGGVGGDALGAQLEVATLVALFVMAGVPV